MNPHLLSLLCIPYDHCRRTRCARRAKTQADLNTLYSGRRFVLFERYSVLLNTAFVCLMFSAGMPILWLVGAATFAATYWFDKITFLRSYRIPPRYDESLDEYAAHILPGAVVPHLMLALWFFSSPMTLSHPLGNAIPFAQGAAASSSSVGLIRTGVASLKERLFQWNTFPAVLLLLLLGALFLAAKLYALIFFCRASEIERRNARLGAAELKSRTRAVTYTEACAKVGLESYRISRQHEWRPAFIVTESKKQLPVELDLHLLREYEANAKAGLANIKASQDAPRRKNSHSQKHARAPSAVASNQVAPMPLSLAATVRAGGLAGSGTGSASKHAAASATEQCSPSPSVPGGVHGGSGSVDLGRTAPAAAWGARRPSQVVVGVPVPVPVSGSAGGPLGGPSASASSPPSARTLGLHRPSASVQLTPSSSFPAPAPAPNPASPASSHFAQQRQMQQQQQQQPQQQQQLQPSLAQLQQQQHQLLLAAAAAAASASRGGGGGGRAGRHNSSHSISLAPWGTTTAGGSNGHNTEQLHVVPSFCVDPAQESAPLAIAQLNDMQPSAAGAAGGQAQALHVSDTVLLGMAAAVADPTQQGYMLLPISCATCANLFQIVDCGEPMSYTCPFCSAQTII